MSAPDLRAALNRIFNRPVSDCSRTLSPWSSSCAIENLTIHFADGESLEAILKNLGPDGTLNAARVVRPSFVYTPAREIEVYRALLEPFHLGAPRLYGAIVDPALERYWLFLEKVHAPVLFELGAFERWLDAAAWLARLHGACDPGAARAAAPNLLEHDAGFYRQWLQRAQEYAGPVLDRIAAGYDHVTDTLLGLPRAWIHGEFYPSNILVRGEENDLRVCPVDWELSAVGPALWDIATLASGKWTRSERLQLLEAYMRAIPSRLQPRDAIRAFDCCQLQIAIQWIGWSRNWRPPEPHAHDWLSEAIAIAGQPSLAGFFDGARGLA